MSRASLHPLFTFPLLLAATSCEGPAAPDVMCDAGDPACCAMDPSSPACETDCAAHPEAPTCRPSCEDEPTQDACHSSCAETPLAAHCVPPDARPEAEVELLRDSLGVTHVYAGSDADVYFGSGYAQATDRLFQMDRERRRALGRQAEVFGRSRLAEDRLVRTMDIAGWAELGAARMQREEPDVYALLVAWTRGVNARIAEVRAGSAPMPEGFVEAGFQPEPWRIMDGVAVGKLVLFGASNQLQNDMLITIVRDYFPEIWASVPFLVPFVDAFAVPAADRPTASTETVTARPDARAPRARSVDVDAVASRFAESHALFDRLRPDGSNNWAMDGRHTENGRPLVAGDPHLALGTPSTLWAHHLNSADAGGSIDVIGFSFVGTPGVQLGYNRSLVWTATLNYPDMMDLWDVRVDGDGAAIGGTSERIVRRVHQIGVLGEDDVEHLVERVPGRGVLLPDDLAPIPLTFRPRRVLFDWTGFAPTRDFPTFHQMTKATTTAELEAAIDTMEIGAFNWIAADQSSITYLSSMWFPVRAGRGEQPWVMLDGDDPDAFWRDGYLPRAMLPRSRATERGWIATANNDPFGWTADGDPANDAYYFGVYFDSGTRAGRIHEQLTALAARGAVTPADFEVLQTDAHSVFADRLIALLATAWAAVPSDDALATFRGRTDLGDRIDALGTWDRQMQRSRFEPLLFTVLSAQFAIDVLADELGFAFEPVFDAVPIYLLKVPTLAAEGTLPGGDALFNGEDWRLVLLRSLDATLAWYGEHFAGRAPEDVTWDEVHCAAVGAASAAPDGCEPVDGGDGTVNVATASMIDEDAITPAHVATTGASYRMVASFADDGVPEARVAFGPGNVETPSSPYYANTLADWVEGRYRALPFRRADVDADQQERVVVTP